MGSIIETQREVAVTDLDVDAVMRGDLRAHRELTRADSARPSSSSTETIWWFAPPRVHAREVDSRITVEGTFPVGSPTRSVGDPGATPGGSAIRSDGA